jgi:long-subunit fatty acid transport protein
MNPIIRTAVTFAALSAASSAVAQGMLSIRPPRDDFEKRLPFTVSVHGGGGYDSNMTLSKDDEHDSFYTYGGAALQYEDGNRRTFYNASLSYTGFYYFDAPESQADYQQNARASFGITHKVNPRLTLTDSLYAAYEFTPNYSIGAGTTRRTQSYLYGYNNISAIYAWTRKFSTVTSYSISGFDYQEDALQDSNYLQHVFAQQFRYALSRLTTASLEYRYQMLNYDSGVGDYTSHYILAGLDHSFNRQLWGSFRAGAEIVERDVGGSDTNPYFEGALHYRAGKTTTLSWYGRVGVESSSVGTYTDRYSYRTGLTANHQINSRLSGSVGLHYIHDEFDASTTDAPSYNQDVFAFSIGLDYLLFKNVYLNASYNFTTSDAEGVGTEYDRHEIGVGLRAVF